MVNISSVTALWNGFTGGPGYSVFRFTELDSAIKLNAAGAAVRAFFVPFLPFMASGAQGWNITVQALVQHHDIGTGDLMGEATMTTVPPQANGSGAAGTVYAGGSGAVIHWTTGLTHAGRKIRGRTYLVPALSTAFSADGTITAALVTAMTGAGNALIADSTTEFGVYSRFWDKKPGDPPLGTPPKQVGGAFAAASGCIVPDRSAQLRTRRN